MITLTKDLISDAQAAEPVGPAAPPAQQQQQQQQQELQAAAGPSAEAAAAPAPPGPVPQLAAITQAPEVRLPSVLPPQVAQQIKDAQQRAALAGQAPPAWAIGALCQAIYSGDGQVNTCWCSATVESCTWPGILALWCFLPGWSQRWLDVWTWHCVCGGGGPSVPRAHAHHSPALIPPTQWYNAVVEAVSASGNFIVAFEG